MCQHDRLHFGSGDYYVMCEQCGCVWGKLNGRQPEYGLDERGKQIGCDPLACDTSFVADGTRRVTVNTASTGCNGKFTHRDHFVTLEPSDLGQSAPSDFGGPADCSRRVTCLELSK